MCQCCGGKNVAVEHKDIYLPTLATIKSCRMMNKTEMYYHLELDNGEPLGHQPGQFVEVSVAGFGESPISISSSPTQNGFELVVRSAGRVTGAMHKLKAGDKVGIRGPYGSGYPVEEFKGRNLVFVCGGIGLVPQRSLINYVLAHRSDFGDVAILQGTKCFEDRVYVEELQKWSKRGDVQVLETVDVKHDCWNGCVGVVTTLLPKVKTQFKSAVNLICGPPIMYKFVLMSLREYEVPKEQIFVNLERRMKCGVGKCGHCQINNIYVCQDGPVFRYSELGNMPEAI